MKHWLILRALTWWGGLPASDRRALLLVTVFLSVVFGYVWFIEPLLQRYDAAQTALLDLGEQERRYTRQVTLLARREAKLQEHRAALTALQNHFKLDAVSPEATVSRTITELSYYARLANVKLNAIRPMEVQAGERYRDLPLEAEAIGEYEALQRFFYYIDTSSSLLAITDLDLRSDEQGPLQARLKVSAITRGNDGQAAEGTRPKPANRLELVLSHWTGNAALVVAKAQGWLDTDELRVELLPIDDNITAERLLLSGEVDGIATGLPELLNFWVKGLPLKTVMPLDKSNGTQGIVVAAGGPLKSLADLSGQDIAVDAQGTMQIVLYQALQSVHLPLEAVKLRSLEPGQVARELVSGTVEVGVTREPYLSVLRDEGQGRVVYASDGTHGYFYNVLAVAPSALEKKRKALAHLLQAVLKGQEFIAEQAEQASEIVARWQGQSPVTTAAVLRRVQFFDRAKAIEFFNEDRLSEALTALEGIYDGMHQAYPMVTPKDLIEPSLLQGEGFR